MSAEGYEKARRALVAWHRREYEPVSARLAETDRFILAGDPDPEPRPRVHRTRRERFNAAQEKHALGKGGLRLLGIENLIRVRHGDQVTGDVARPYRLVAAAAIAAGSREYGLPVFLVWCRKWTPDPGLTDQELEKILADAADLRIRLSGTEAAQLLGVTEAFRRYCETINKPLRTFGATDCTPGQREKARRERDNASRAEKRRAAGKPTRAEYIANSISAAKPWEAEGVSRRTWYARRKVAAQVVRAVGLETPANAQPVQGYSTEPHR